MDEQVGSAALAGGIAQQDQIRRQVLTLDRGGNAADEGHPDEGIGSGSLCPGELEGENAADDLQGNIEDHDRQQAGAKRLAEPAGQVEGAVDVCLYSHLSGASCRHIQIWKTSWFCRNCTVE